MKHPKNRKGETKDTVRDTAVKIAEALGKMEEYGIGYHRNRNSRGDYSGSSFHSACMLYYTGMWQYIKKLETVLQVSERETMLTERKVEERAFGYTMEMASDMEVFFYHQKLFTRCGKNRCFDADSDDINEFLFDLTEEYNKFFSDDIVQKVLEHRDYIEDCEDEDMEEFWMTTNEIMALYNEVLCSYELSENSVYRKLAEEFAKLVREYFFESHTCEELLSNPDFMHSVMSCYLTLLYTSEDGYGGTLGYCNLNIYRNDKIYRFMTEEKYRKEFSLEERTAIGQCIKALHYIQEEPVIGGLLLSEKDKTAYLYVTYDSYLNETEYGFETVLRRTVAAIRVLEVLLGR